MKTFLLLFLLLPFCIKAKVQKVEREQADTIKSITIEAVVVEKKKKAVEHLPDRIIYNIAEQNMLNAGSMLQGLKKIPGLIASESVDLMYQGTSLTVYMDGRPLRIDGNSLMTFLEGLPANAVERVEIITSPGAEFSASSGNAIINIISAHRSADFTTLTYAGNYSFSNYEKIRHKTNNSIFLASKLKNLNWRINLGQSYKNNMMKNDIMDILSIHNDRENRYFYLRPNFTYRLKQSKLSLDYDFSKSNMDNTVKGFNMKDTTNLTLRRSELAVGYQRLFNDPQKKFETKLSYTFVNQGFMQHAQFRRNKSHERIYSLKVDYSIPLDLLDGSKLNLGSKYEGEQMYVYNDKIQTLEVSQNTFATYAEFLSQYENYDLIVGLRGENYNNSSHYEQDKILYQRVKFFPNATIRYNIMKSVFASINYSSKIKLPSISSLNPNSSNFENSHLTYVGNPYLQPTTSNNINLKFSAFDYANLGFNLNYINNDVILLAEKTDNKVIYTFQPAPDLRIQTFSIGIPVPLMVFRKGFKELMKFDFDLEKMNILYFYMDYEKYKSSLIGNQKGICSFFASGQFIIPGEINLQTIYKLTNTGNFRYYLIDKPFQNTLDLSISKKFLNNKLSISLSANDIFNTNETVVRTLPLINGVSAYQKMDSRSFGISFNYKIFTSKNGEHNKQKKDDSNLLDHDILINK